MKILSVAQIREADAFTIQNEPIADIDLMERAAGNCVDWIASHLGCDHSIVVFCGSGNNGGDGFAIARMLLARNYNAGVFNLASPEKMSPSCKMNFDRMVDTGWLAAEEGDAFPVIDRNTIVIDAIFGSGLTRPPEGRIAGVIDHINGSGAVVIAIDVPSGLFCDASVSRQVNPRVIRADYTLSFSPKLAFFFPENDAYVGNWQLLDIGLSPEFISCVAVRNFVPGQPDISRLLKKRNKFAHKGHFGHALLICGATGKMGAAVLSAKACLRSGPGLVTVRVPASGVTILQSSAPEAMLSIDPDPDCFTMVPDLNVFSSIAIGPGTGTVERTANALKLLIQQARVPIIFDADAINILGENKTWLAFIPAGCIFTPHPKEFERLVGKSRDDFERNELQKEFSRKNNCYVVLKGAHTAITTPGGDCYFNTTGNPGMATGGSGDVLTGIIAGLMAQGYSSLDACLAGVYLHGLAGDLALESQGYESLIASDIISHLGKSFQQLYGKL